MAEVFSDDLSLKIGDRLLNNLYNATRKPRAHLFMLMHVCARASSKLRSSLTSAPIVESDLFSNLPSYIPKVARLSGRAASAGGRAPRHPPCSDGGARAGFWPKKGVAIAHTRAILWTKISGRTLLFCEMSPRATAIAGAITSQGAFLPLGPSHRKAQYNTLRAGALRKPGLHGRRAAVLMQMVQ